MNDHDLFDDLIGGAMTKSYSTLYSKQRRRVRELNKAVEPLAPFVRSRMACPACGYSFASVNETRGIVHCSKCHRSQAWPIERPPVEQLARSIGEHLRLVGIGKVEYLSKTSFQVTPQHESFVVTVTRAPNTFGFPT